MNIGVFHPCLNLCGGGEFVALNVIKTLKQRGHKVIVLTDEKIDQSKYTRTFGEKANPDGEIVFPMQFFRSGDLHNVYTDAIRCLMLKTKCEVVIDTFTNAVLPGTDVVYIHYPFFKHFPNQLRRGSRLTTQAYYLLYRTYEKRLRKDFNRLIFSNSKFTYEAIRETLGIKACLLYPPVSSFFLEDAESVLKHQRDSNIVTVSRIAPEKNLEIIPHIAKLVNNSKFVIIGSKQNEETYLRLTRLIKKFGVADKVVLLTNVSRTQLREILRGSKAYLHTAVKEHFGISIVEGMASGCIPVVHDSGGPREYVPSSLRYTSIEEAAAKVENAISGWSPEKGLKMFKTASRFSETDFSESLLVALNSHGILHA